jgi:hypothetical protein
MWIDPIVAETRKAREEHAAKFNYDLHAIYRDLKEHERHSKSKLVSLSPKRPTKIEKRKVAYKQARATKSPASCKRSEHGAGLRRFSSHALSLRKR